MFVKKLIAWTVGWRILYKRTAKYWAEEQKASGILMDDRKTLHWRTAQY
jgi:hypothetical protein